MLLKTASMGLGMASESGPPPEDGLDADIYAQRDVWQIQGSYNTYFNVQQADGDLIKALANLRAQLEPIKESYARAVNDEGGITSTASRKRRVLFKELNRKYGAIEKIKNELSGRGVHYAIWDSDEEHPNAAYNRYLRTWHGQARTAGCYVVTAFYGSNSRELTRAVLVCRRRFALNPLVGPSWLLYRLLRPFLLALFYSDFGRALLHRFIAKPIVKASNRSVLIALPWMIYLALWGWAVIVAVWFGIEAL